MHILEMSTDITHHHVPGAEFGRGVSGFKSPFSHYRAPRKSGSPCYSAAPEVPGLRLQASARPLRARPRATRGSPQAASFEMEAEPRQFYPRQLSVPRLAGAD